MAYISLISAGGGLRPLADRFVVGVATPAANAASTAGSPTPTAAAANTTNALESTTGLVANVWA